MASVTISTPTAIRSPTRCGRFFSSLTAGSWAEEQRRVKPLSFKLAGVLSIAIWTAIILCGRLIAYF